MKNNDFKVTGLAHLSTSSPLQEFVEECESLLKLMTKRPSGEMASFFS